ncbi:osmosensitive K+ channel signal transduction histidine kinase [Ancylobacter aquaticus]|uniref:histidine kinase n=1 Tax=Ancylobacter aquaticus TaxID=100 RepID=A0A4R1I394_ANCAQ|nr:sensor histidine kinase KdpD [Ancylobacter aquaticus]TCK28095.1 osmosensitive K+ channel signal transduction histidine kinase [Ancylobacter aquaticus]
MSAEEAPRADPDALLAAAEREARGKLRIFLGAAPGVGKTYAMLSAARATQAGGRDVVVGLVETHARAETEALTAGLEMLPRKGIAYRGRLVPEFDLEAALARRPALLLVDEYAHSNVEGSRHPKRWQDVQDLLAAGIDVWTTLNIQHVESLNDVVQRITGVRVRETVPDAALRKADEIILVDLPSDELLKRLADGKVYVEDTASRAVQSFFKPSNLTALRELALRRVAAQVDSDLVERMQGAAIEGPWAAGERLLVCVGPDMAAERVVREAKRLADLMDAAWFAVTVERPGQVMATPDRQKLDAGLRLAESLGAEVRALVAGDVAAELLRFARFENVTQIIIGKARRRWPFGALRRPLADALVRTANGIAIHVVTAQASEGRAGWRSRLAPAGPLAGYVTAGLGVATATLLGLVLTRFVALPNVSMLYLLAVLLPALLHGVWPAILASAMSFLAYNFFFIDPVETFTVARPHELLALLVFLIVAVIISAIAGRAREQARLAARRMRATRRLYDFTRKLSALPDRASVAEAAVVELHAALGRASVILLAQEGTLALAAAWPPEDRLDTASMTAAGWAFEHGEAAGAGTGTLPRAPWLFLPLGGLERGARIGVVGIEHDGAAPLDTESEGLLGTLAEQTAAALLRTQLSAEVTRVRTAAETERVRNILLASISHDFRTPLASILGAATSLLDYGPGIPEEARRDLLAQMREEAENLDLMVRNLLSMTRLEAGALDMRRDWVDVVELMHRAVATVKKRGATQRFVVTSAPGLPLIEADPSLMDQALGNVVANAVRYAGVGAHIRLSATVIDGQLVVAVTDDGPGIPAETLPHVFEKFVRAPRGAGDGGDGSGLGLAITRGIVEAHGGSVSARSPAPGQTNGARIAMRLPLSPQAATPEDEP